MLVVCAPRNLLCAGKIKLHAVLLRASALFGSSLLIARQNRMINDMIAKLERKLRSMQLRRLPLKTEPITEAKKAELDDGSGQSRRCFLDPARAVLLCLSGSSRLLSLHPLSSSSPRPAQSWVIGRHPCTWAVWSLSLLVCITCQVPSGVLVH